MLRLDVEVAADAASRAQGLMGRRSLATNAGLLFLFERPENQSFWMRDTPLPLSIAFIDAQWRITQIEDMLPFDEEHVTSFAPALAALEVNQGWFERNEVSVGDVIEYEPLAQTITFSPELAVSAKLANLYPPESKAAFTDADWAAAQLGFINNPSNYTELWEGSTPEDIRLRGVLFEAWDKAGPCPSILYRGFEIDYWKPVPKAGDVYTATTLDSWTTDRRIGMSFAGMEPPYYVLVLPAGAKAMHLPVNKVEKEWLVAGECRIVRVEKTTVEAFSGSEMPYRRSEDEVFLLHCQQTSTRMVEAAYSPKWQPYKYEDWGYRVTFPGARAEYMGYQKYIHDDAWFKHIDTNIYEWVLRRLPERIQQVCNNIQVVFVVAYRSDLLDKWMYNNHGYGNAKAWYSNDDNRIYMPCALEDVDPEHKFPQGSSGWMEQQENPDYWVEQFMDYHITDMRDTLAHEFWHAYQHATDFWADPEHREIAKLVWSNKGYMSESQQDKLKWWGMKKRDFAMPDSRQLDEMFAEGLADLVMGRGAGEWDTTLNQISNYLWEKVGAHDRLGRCYELAGRYVSDATNRGAVLVHGSIQGMGNPRNPHAWVDTGTDIYDPVLDERFPYDAYKVFFSAQEDARYTQEQTWAASLRAGHWGPWTDKTAKRVIDPDPYGDGLGNVVACMGYELPTPEQWKEASKENFDPRDIDYYTWCYLPDSREFVFNEKDPVCDHHAFEDFIDFDSCIKLRVWLNYPHVGRQLSVVNAKTMQTIPPAIMKSITDALERKGYVTLDTPIQTDTEDSSVAEVLKVGVRTPAPVLERNKSDYWLRVTLPDAKPEFMGLDTIHTENLYGVSDIIQKLTVAYDRTMRRLPRVIENAVRDAKVRFVFIGSPYYNNLSKNFGKWLQGAGGWYSHQDGHIYIPLHMDCPYEHDPETFRLSLYLDTTEISATLAHEFWHWFSDRTGFWRGSNRNEELDAFIMAALGWDASSVGRAFRKGGYSEDDELMADALQHLVEGTTGYGVFWQTLQNFIFEKFGATDEWLYHSTLQHKVESILSTGLRSHPNSEFLAQPTHEVFATDAPSEKGRYGNATIRFRRSAIPEGVSVSTEPSFWGLAEGLSEVVMRSDKAFVIPASAIEVVSEKTAQQASWLYHGTATANVEAIKRDGLKSSFEGWQEGNEPHRLYTFKHWSKGFGNTVVRFPRSAVPAGVHEKVTDFENGQGEVILKSDQPFVIPAEVLSFSTEKEAALDVTDINMNNPINKDWTDWDDAQAKWLLTPFGVDALEMVPFNRHWAVAKQVNFPLYRMHTHLSGVWDDDSVDYDGAEAVMRQEIEDAWQVGTVYRCQGYDSFSTNRQQAQEFFGGDIVFVLDPPAKAMALPLNRRESEWVVAGEMVVTSFKWVDNYTAEVHLRQTSTRVAALDPQLIHDTTEDKGGGTWRIDRGDAYSGKGFSVSEPSANEHIPLEDWTPERARQEIDERDEQKGKWLGTWVDTQETKTKTDDEVYVDVNNIYDDKQKAMDEGKAHDQLAIYDFGSGKEIRLAASQGVVYNGGQWWVGWFFPQMSAWYSMDGGENSFEEEHSTLFRLGDPDYAIPSTLDEAMEQGWVRIRVLTKWMGNNNPPNVWMQVKDPDAKEGLVKRILTKLWDAGIITPDFHMNLENAVTFQSGFSGVVKDYMGWEKVANQPWDIKETWGDAIDRYQYNSRYTAYTPDGTAVGFIEIAYIYNEAHIEYVFTEPTYRRQGVATALVEYVRQYIKDEGKNRELIWSSTTDEGTLLREKVGQVQFDSEHLPPGYRYAPFSELSSRQADSLGVTTYYSRGHGYLMTDQPFTHYLAADDFGIERNELVEMANRGFYRVGAEAMGSGRRIIYIEGYGLDLDLMKKIVGDMYDSGFAKMDDKWEMYQYERGANNLTSGLVEDLMMEKVAEVHLTARQTTILTKTLADWTVDACKLIHELDAAGVAQEFDMNTVTEADCQAVSDELARRSRQWLRDKGYTDLLTVWRAGTPNPNYVESFSFDEQAARFFGQRDGYEQYQTTIDKVLTVDDALLGRMNTFAESEVQLFGRDAMPAKTAQFDYDLKDFPVERLTIQDKESGGRAKTMLGKVVNEDDLFFHVVPVDASGGETTKLKDKGAVEEHTYHLIQKALLVKRQPMVTDWFYGTLVTPDKESEESKRYKADAEKTAKFADYDYFFDVWSDIYGPASVKEGIYTEIDKDGAALKVISMGDYNKEPSAKKLQQNKDDFDEFFGKGHWLSAPGNHEITWVDDAPHDLDDYFSIIGWGEDAVLSGQEASFWNAEGACFILVNAAFEQPLSEETYATLENILMNNDIDGVRRFVFLHRPAIDSVPPDENEEDHGMVDGDRFSALMAKYHVDIVFSSHQHGYETWVRDGVFYVGTAGGGSPLDEPQEQFHFVRVFVGEVTRIERVPLFPDEPEKTSG